MTSVTIVATKKPNVTEEQWFASFSGDAKNRVNWCNESKTLFGRANNHVNDFIITFSEVDVPAMNKCKYLDFQCILILLQFLQI
jgi:hypothetical protein